MHEHDLDLIMALAEGTLGASDAASAEAEIAACAECSEDLGLQRLALNALRTATPVAMTSMESQRLRRALRRELGLVPVAVPTKPPRRWFSMGALATAAALLLALVIVGPGLNLLGTGGDDSADDTATFAASATTTTAAAATDDNDAGGVESQRDNAGIAGDAGTEEAAEAAPPSEQPTTTTAAAAETTIAVPVPASSVMLFEGQPNLVTLRDAIIELGITADTDLTQYAGSLRSQGLSFEFEAADGSTDDHGCIAAGLESIPLATSGYVLGQAPFDDATALVSVYEPGAPDDIIVAVQDPTTCAILAATP